MAKSLHWATEPKVLELGRAIHYFEVSPKIAEYAAKVEADGVEVVVMEDKVHFNDGYQWAYQKEIVKMTRADAEALAAAEQVRILA